MAKSDDFLKELIKLRNGERIVCSDCGKGHIVTDYDYKTSNFFYCDNCGVKLNIN